MADNREIEWQALSIIGGALAGLATRQVMVVAWRAVAGTEPPENPADRRTSWPEALAWATAAGVGVGVARLVALRLSAAAWEAATKEAPPGVQTA
jgi:hypothetical protein